MKISKKSLCKSLHKKAQFNEKLARILAKILAKTSLMFCKSKCNLLKKWKSNV